MRGEEAVRKKGFYELGSFPVLQQQYPEGMREEEWGVSVRFCRGLKRTQDISNGPLNLLRAGVVSGWGWVV